MKLGSLFDGSGTAPLAASICGIDPVWASEIEPYPIRVTTARFPHMKHLGDITQINGAEIEPVDIICGGSPCQDLSVAGKQAGIHAGERSHLFFEMTRIIKEMRESTNGKYPKYIIWENVPGAFSSNNGNDFLAVLQSFAEIAEDDVLIPRPATRGKTERFAWTNSGEVVGDGWSIAWRTVDAQYWGVPQRRRRIYLVADFADGRAGEILFERKGMRWDSAPSGEAREGTADDAAGSAGGSCGVGGIAFHLQQDPIHSTEVSPCIGGQHQACIGVACFMGGQGAKAGSVAYSEDVSPTIKSVMSGGNTVPDVVYPTTARTLEARHDSSPCIDRGQNFCVYALQGNGIDRSDTAGCNGCGWRENECYTLNTIDRPAVVYPETVGALNATDYKGIRNQNVLDAVVYDCRGNGDGETAANLTGDHENRVTDYTNAVVYDKQRLDKYSASETSSTLTAHMAKEANDIIVEKQRRYIVRRLTPLECCRLQGFPDCWTDGVEGSDSAKYKMWGNGMALPNMLHVMRGIANER